jgi:molecular chaperone DnaK
LLSPDEAVAHGAALYHGIFRAETTGESKDATQLPKIVNVNAHSLGLVTRTRAPVRLLNSILIPRNTALPHSGSQVFRTGRTGQSQIQIRIVEGEAPDPSECNLLGKFSIEPLPAGLPAGSPIRLHYSYDESGRIKVRAVVDVPSLKTEVRIARRGSTIGQNVDDWAMGLLKLTGDDESDA